MAHKGADKDEVNDAIKNVNGNIVRTMTNGRLTCYVVELPPRELQQAMSKLSKDKSHFDSVQPALCK